MCDGSHSPRQHQCIHTTVVETESPFKFYISGYQSFFKKKSVFKFSQTIGEMVFISFVDEKSR